MAIMRCGEEGGMTYLAGGVPHVDLDCAQRRPELHRPNLDAERGDISLLVLAGNVAAAERRLARAAIANDDHFDVGNFSSGCWGRERGSSGY